MINKIKNFSNINIGERIRTFRSLNNLTIKDLQTNFYKYGCYINIKTIYHWENNNIIPNLSCIIILCDIFNITTSTFLNDETHRKPNLAKAEINFLLMIRKNKQYKKLITSLYNKEVSRHDKNRTKIKNSSKIK